MFIFYMSFELLSSYANYEEYLFVKNISSCVFFSYKNDRHMTLGKCVLPFWWHGFLYTLKRVQSHETRLRWASACLNIMCQSPCVAHMILADIRCEGTNIHAPTLHSAHRPWYILEIITETNRTRIPRIPKKNKIHHRNYSLTVRGDACEIRAICFVTHCRRQNLLTTEGRQ